MCRFWVVWGQLVREHRYANGFSLEDLARVAGISRSQLSRIENGQRGTSDAVKIRLADSLGVEPDELFPLVLDDAA